MAARLTILMLMIWSPTIHAQEPPVSITLHVRGVRLEEVLSSIGRQSGCYFVYDIARVRAAGRVTLDLDHVSLREALDRAFEGLPLGYAIFDKTIVVRSSTPPPPAHPSALLIKGRVTSEKKEAVPGATISLAGSSRGVFAGEDGVFSLSGVHPGDTLRVSCIGYEPKNLVIKGSVPLDVTLHTFANTLDETVIIAYGRTTRRLNTGSVAKVTRSDLGLQPVADPLAMLQGRVPGLLVTASSGVPGSYYKIQVRGQSSILQGSDPLIVIDGVPYAPNNNPLNQMASAAGGTTGGGLSPLALINPADIESIEILKDADATAIYGSRGAAGVILITTRKGSAGKAGISIDAYTGAGSVTRTLPFEGTPAYLAMRRAAFAGDGVTPTPITAPDLLVWDTTRYTDFNKLLIGHWGETADVQAGLSAGSDQTQVLLSGSYHAQESVYPGALEDQRGGMYASVNHHSANKRFAADFMFDLTSDHNASVAQDLAASVNLPPDYPALRDATGKLSWQADGITFSVNPLAYLLDRYDAHTTNLLTHLQLTFQVAQGLSLKASIGYNALQVSETGIQPIAAQNPAASPTGFAQFGDRYMRNWIAEPQAEYNTRVGKGHLLLLAGTTWQGLSGTNQLTSAYGYRDDALLGSTNGASGLSTVNTGSLYRYEAVFGRLTYNLRDQYLLNLSARKDGSSRFGPGKQFASFGAAGAAWIFSKAPAIRTLFPFLSYGKLRASYGITGNDQIGDYQYLDVWSSTPYPYLGSLSLYPVRLYNPFYSWEINRKLEGALELGFAGDRVISTTAWYMDRGGNQLIRYGLPLQTGFSGLTENFPALVQNTGWEEELTTRNITTRHLQWTTSLNLTLPFNRLKSFPGIATSSYSNLAVGQPLSTVDGFVYKGVDSSTGAYKFKDVNGDGQITYPEDYVRNIAHLAPTFFGGLSTTLRYRAWQFDALASFRFQTGANYYYYYYNNGYIPGTIYNQPVQKGTVWTNGEQTASIQRYTAGYNSTAYLAGYDLANSTAAYTDASFLRLTNVSLSYTLDAGLAKKCGMTQVQVYARGQNLLTYTHYKGADPETQNAFVLPPLKVVVAGLHCQF